VGKRYGNAAVVDDFDLAIRKNEFVTLLGPSGCGKTTTLRMIAGFIQPSAGEIALEGRNLSSATSHIPPEHRNIGMVFQSYAVWPHMTVRQNIELPLRLRKLDRAEIRRRMGEVLELCRLGSLAERSPHQLSGGQLQRVALARALVYRPPLVLLDEPLSNLDVALREELRHEIRQLHRAIDSTFILVTHDQVEAMSLSDRVVVMRDGRIEQVGAPAEIYRAPKTDFVAHFVGSANVLEGCVEVVEPGERVRCKVRVGPLLFTVRGWAGAVPGASVSLAIHPEAVQLAGGEAILTSENRFEGRIRAASFLGRTQEAEVDVGGVLLRAVQVRGNAPTEGENVSVCISPETIVAIGVGNSALQIRKGEETPNAAARRVAH
jgi:ABC-type Fe3+/spermidine/putrescine transport system ATPase subunit